MAIVTGLFDDYDDAKLAVSQLEEADISSGDISIVSNTNGRTVEEQGTKAGEGAGAGAGIGAVAGGAGGLLAGLGMLAIPGVGPVVAAGWLAATLAGAGAGAVVGGAAGGVIGALVKSGVPEEDAHVYAESIRRGGTLVMARVEGDQIVLANDILQRSPRVDLSRRRALYSEQGWDRFDETLDPYDRNGGPTRYAPTPRI
ncbi:MAG: hypothetical protein KGI75_30885 [Rhizobiaceae bacterium]|nr:hypothetical protein [Rhizobiaceae bacterium]